MESVPIPKTNEYNGSEGGINGIKGINFTFQFAQHNPLTSFLYFNALHYWQTEFIGTIATQL